MNKEKIKILKKDRRRNRIRAKVNGTKELPRLSVFKSNAGMYLQLIDDEAGQTLVSASSQEIKLGKSDRTEGQGEKTAVSFALGKLLAEKAKAKKITQVVFDRGGNKYHGRVKAVADGARAGGLEF
jgi:large subunit ribosomal protein L18